MKKILLLLIISISLLLSSCKHATMSDGNGNVINLSNGEVYEQRFITVYDQGTFYIIADKETKVQYLAFHDINEGGITVLVDEYGKPILYESEEIEE